MHFLTFLLTAAAAAVLPNATPLANSPVPAAAAAAKNYEISAKGPASMETGGKGTVVVTVKPAAGWHMNLDFPASLALTTSDGLSVASAKLKKGDAKKLDDSGLVFEVSVGGKAAGAQTVGGTLKFAVCRDDACAPSKEKISVRIDVH